VYPKLGKRAHLYSKRETQERDGESAFRCCAVIGLRAAIFPPNGTRVCVAQEHHATRRPGVQEVLVQYRNRADKLQTRSSAHRNGTLRLSAHGLRFTGFDQFAYCSRGVYSTTYLITQLPRYPFKCRKFKCDLANCCIYLNFKCFSSGQVIASRGCCSTISSRLNRVAITIITISPPVRAA